LQKNKQIVIVGAGIIGLFTAYYLMEEGFDITIIEKSDGAEGCSTGNAGMVVPSHIFPLAAPGMIEKGLRWMFDAQSPFYVKPRIDWNLLKWGMHFYKAANQKQVEKAKIALRDISLFSKEKYLQLAKKEQFSFGFEERGLLMLCKTEKLFEEEVEAAHQATAIGIKGEILSKEQVHKLESETKPNVVGGVLYPGDAHLYPNVLFTQLKSELNKKGVLIEYNSELIDFEGNTEDISTIVYKKGNKTHKIKCNELIIATGSWSQSIAEKLKTNMPMQAGKGYSVTKPQIEGKKINIPSILLEARVAVTPFDSEKIRFGGTMEIGGINGNIDMNRVKGIVKSVPNFYPDYQLDIPEKTEIWYGLRPCSPDGLPYIGRSEKYKNLTYATGHAMMGLSLAPGTGKLVSEIIMNQKSSVDLGLFAVERF
jgi:D-amino-acid dehydrogenase